MEDFNRLVESFMKLDKQTLAELLAIKETEKNSISPITLPYHPYYYFPPYPYWDDWRQYPYVSWTSSNSRDTTVQTN